MSFGPAAFTQLLDGRGISKGRHVSHFSPRTDSNQEEIDTFRRAGVRAVRRKLLIVIGCATTRLCEIRGVELHDHGGSHYFPRPQRSLAESFALGRSAHRVRRSAHRVQHSAHRDFASNLQRFRVSASPKLTRTPPAGQFSLFISPQLLIGSFSKRVIWPITIQRHRPYDPLFRW